jgi:hypothetical protein
MKTSWGFIAVPMLGYRAAQLLVTYLKVSMNDVESGIEGLYEPLDSETIDTIRV